MKKFLLLLCLFFSPAWAEPLWYTFQTSEGGGIARLQADPHTGQIQTHEIVVSSAEYSQLKKITVSADERFLAANLEKVEDQNNLLLVDSSGSARLLSFEDEVDEIEFHQGMLYVGTTKGQVHRVDPESADTLHSWNFRKLLTPSGRRPEDFFFDDSHGVLWISFQKDSKNRKHLGSRIVGIDLKNDKVIADLQLPRDRPELHYAPEVDGRESGPNPEVLYVDPQSNTLFVTLDLYGAVGMADLDAALKGRLENWTTHSTAPDGSWGTAFPDRVGSFTREGKTYLLVANSGAAGGTAVVDLHHRKVLQVLNTPHGLTSLHDLPFAELIVTGNSGKLKSRGEGGLDKETVPNSVWTRFAGEVDSIRADSRSMSFPVHHLAPVDAGQSRLVYLNVLEDAGMWGVYDPANEKALSAERAFGEVQRLSR